MQRTDFWTQWEERVGWFERVALKHVYYQVSLMAQLVKNPPAMQETRFDSWVRKIPWRRDRLPTPVLWPGEFHGLYSSWGRKESDRTELLSLSYITQCKVDDECKFHA